MLTNAAAAEEFLYGSASKSTSAPTDLSSGSAIALVAEGSFAAKDARIPAGSPVPTGQYLTQVVRVSDGVPMDWGLSDVDPRLASLGLVQTG